MNIFFGLFVAVLFCYSFALDPLTSVPAHQIHHDRSWRDQAVNRLWDERTAMGRTPLVKFEIEGMPHLDLRFKNESASRSGNLKHRFAWALFMWALTEGFIGPNTTVYEASSGNTATSEAYMARLIGVEFVAVVPNTTEKAKIDNIEKYGGKVHRVDISKTFQKAEELAKENGGFYMNQFGNAFLAEEFHLSGGSQFESTNVYHECLVQLKIENVHGVTVDYFVHTAGTGGTISSVGRFIQKYVASTKVVLADTQYSMYYDYVINGRFSTENDSAASLWVKPGMAGTGYGYAGAGILGKTTSLLPAVIDIAYKIPDLASTAAMHVLKESGIEGGTSTGLNFITSLSIAATEKKPSVDDKLRIVTLLCDSSSLYETTYYNESWIATSFEPHGGLKVFNCWKDVVRNSMKHGSDPLEIGATQCKPDGSNSTPSGHENEGTSAPLNRRNLTPAAPTESGFSIPPEGPSSPKAAPSQSPSQSPSSVPPSSPSIQNSSPTSDTVAPSNPGSPSSPSSNQSPTPASQTLASSKLPPSEASSSSLPDGTTPPPLARGRRHTH